MPSLRKKINITESQTGSVSTNKAVDTKSYFYNSKYLDWKMIATIMAGDRAIKAAGTDYIPQLSGQMLQEYEAYLNRGTFYNAFARTVQGLTGAITRKPAAIEIPDKLKPVQDNFTQDGSTLDKIIRFVTQLIMSQGYCGILADLNEEGIPYASVYLPMDIVNLRTIKIKGQTQLGMVVLREQVEQIDSTDPFKTNLIPQIRVLYLDGEGWLTVNLYQYDKAKGGTNAWVQIPINGELEYQPSVIGGVKLNYIPFVFFGTEESSYAPAKPPLLDLAYLNIKHWQVTVDYYYALHICALPTPWAAGFTESEGKELKIGPGTAWVSSTPEAKCGFLEFTGQGLQPIEKALEKLEHQMAVIGARMLEDQKKAAETAEALEIRGGGDSASLASISLCLGQGFKQVLVYMAKWIRLEEKGIEVTLSKDFVSTSMNPQMITALLGALQANKISIDTFLNALQAGEILPENVSIEDEKAKLEMKEQENPYQPPEGIVKEKEEEEK